MRIRTVYGLLACMLFAAAARAAPLQLPMPGPQETCPVCGMFVARYPEWVATVVFRDGHAHHFDGAKDMFKFIHNVPRYDKRHEAGEIQAMAVTEYYGLARIDARQAWFVVGSDVLGPMGHELVPLATEQEAKEFLTDHRGRAILRFDGVTPEVVRQLDEAR